MGNFAKYRTVVSVALVTLLLAGGWYYQVIWNTVKPTIIRHFPVVAAAPPATYSADQSLLNYATLGIQAPVTEQPTLSPFDISQWSTLRADLTKGIALAYAGDSFTDAPYAYLIGHSSDTYPHPYSAVFAGLGQAKIGDSFTLVVKGVPYTYTVRSTQILQPNNQAGFEAPGIEAAAKHTHYVALVTCWPVFTTYHRLMIVAERN